MKTYIITENITDHHNYNGQPVTIIKEHENGYVDVQDAAGVIWHCGIEELTEIDSIAFNCAEG